MKQEETEFAKERDRERQFAKGRKRERRRNRKRLSFQQKEIETGRD